MQKLKWNRAIRITLVWMVLGMIQTLYDHLLLESHFVASFSHDYDLIPYLISNALFGLFGGFIGSMVLVLVDDKYRTRPYYYSVSIIILAFILITATITVVYSLTLTAISYPLFSPEGMENFKALIMTTMHVKNLVFWGFTVAITFFFLQMGNKFGPGNLYKILTGKYNLPKTENRIFMFLDLKSSTTIAEKLGSEKYHAFLKDVFADITAPIIDSKGEIYQYVSDEVVISWSIKENEDYGRCIDCFFDINNTLKELNKKYEELYSIIPEFKAGAHYGSVVAGEIGVIKRDITYSGDILNTCARIQAECNNLNSRFLLSQDLFKLVSPIPESIKHSNKGAIALKGKEEPLELISISD